LVVAGFILLVIIPWFVVLSIGFVAVRVTTIVVGALVVAIVVSTGFVASLVISGVLVAPRLGTHISVALGRLLLPSWLGG
jgi:hypothetical protein